MGFGSRIFKAEKNEVKLLDWLKRNGWMAERFGQGLLSQQMRAALLRVQPATPIRWLPDILAVKHCRVVLLDAKGGRDDTPNVSIEEASSRAALAFSHAMNCQVLHVWAGGRALSAWDAEQIQGIVGPRHHRDGSGTPYRLIPKEELKPIAEYLNGARK